MLRTRITWSVAAVASAVVFAFVIPLCLLVRTLAEDRAVSAAQEQAQAMATIVANVSDESRLVAALGVLDGSGPVRTTVRLPDARLVTASGVQVDGSDPLAERAFTQRAAFTERRDGGADVLVPVVGGGGAVVVHARVDFESVRQGVLTAWAIVVGLGALMLLGAIAVARRLGDRIATPVTDIAEVAHRLREGDLDARADPSGPAEVADLGAALNLLADRIGELLAVERETAADLSHRLRTPATALRLDADLVADDDVADRMREHVEMLHRAIDSVVRDARRTDREGLRGACDATTVVTDRIGFWSALADDQDRVLTYAGPPGALPIALAEADLRDLVDALLDNVFAHTPEGTAARVSLHDIGASERSVRLVVEDAGPGMPSAHDPGRGSSGAGSTGLGLDIAERTARAGGGTMSLGRSALGGLAVTVLLRRL
ncbi:MAG: HAMP domain-containing sensor histidine kinase [Dermatophilaceae bacterium]